MITHNSAMKFRSSAIFQNNQAIDGGALFLHVDENAVLFLNSADINITTNCASGFGGGIYILNSPSIKSLLLSNPLYTFPETNSGGISVDGSCFYQCVDIIGANMSVFFPITLSTNVLAPRVFIAWLNLDLGIEVCFYNGLDTYAKTWLQQVFPVYVWIIVTVIIISSHYSTWAAKLCGKNSVQVLATLFLLSYAKLLRIIIAAFSFTELKTYHSENVNSFSVENVWLYDGNIQYLMGKHIPLFLLALVILVALYVPYTLILTFIQCLQQQSGNRVLFWVI